VEAFTFVFVRKRNRVGTHSVTDDVPVLFQLFGASDVIENDVSRTVGYPVVDVAFYFVDLGNCFSVSRPFGCLLNPPVVAGDHQFHGLRTKAKVK
jgi:hypothetical protein